MLNLNKITIICLSFLLLILSPSSSYSSQWVEVGNKEFVDISSIKIDNQTGYVYYWNKLLTYEKKIIKGKPYWFQLTYSVSDCINNKNTLAAFTWYDTTGSVIETHDFSASYYLNDFTNIVPDSRWEVIHNWVCKYIKNK